MFQEKQPKQASKILEDIILLSFICIFRVKVPKQQKKIETTNSRVALQVSTQGPHAQKKL